MGTEQCSRVKKNGKKSDWFGQNVIFVKVEQDQV